MYTLQAKPWGAFLAQSLLDANGSEAQRLRPWIWDREQLKKATGHRDSQHEHRLYRPELIAKYYWKQRLECQKVLGFHHEIFTLLHSRGWKLFPGNKCLKKTGMGHPHTTQSVELWDAKTYRIFSTLITGSLASAHGQSSNSEEKKSPQNVLELTVVRHVISEGRLFYQDKERLVTWACCLSQVI